MAVPYMTIGEGSHKRKKCSLDEKTSNSSNTIVVLKVQLLATTLALTPRRGVRHMTANKQSYLFTVLPSTAFAFQGQTRTFTQDSQGSLS